MSVERFPVHLQRNAFGPRETARAGDLWRLFQDAAVIGSSRRGWPPERYREVGAAFLVRGMTVTHAGATAFGEALTASTWVSSFKRGVMTDRQLRIDGPRGRVCSATQRWVHVEVPILKPVRARPELEAAFSVVRPEGEGDVVLPAGEPVEGAPWTRFTFDAWLTWMDPLAHANHPAYVDWADEATSRRLRAAGLDPHGLVPVAEEVTWRSGVVAPEAVTVESRVVGVSAAGVTQEHVWRGGDGRLCADGATVRRHADVDADGLRDALARG